MHRGFITTFSFLSYFEDEKNLFVLSSDFCHWGKRFRYTNLYKDATDGKASNIYKGIEAMDRHGMKLIEDLNSKEFLSYREVQIIS